MKLGNKKLIFDCPVDYLLGHMGDPIIRIVSLKSNFNILLSKRSAPTRYDITHVTAVQAIWPELE